MKRILSLFFIFLSLEVSYLNSFIYAQISIFENTREIPNYWTSTNQNKTRQEQTKPMSTLDFISGAKNSIDIEMYEMYHEEVKNLLIKKAKAGVVVRVIIEPKPIGNACDGLSKFTKKNQHCQKSKDYISLINNITSPKEPGIKKNSIRFFNKNLCTANCYQHGKLIIIDQKQVLVSTGNLSDSSICQGKKRERKTCHRDFSIVSDEKKTVRALKTMFEFDFANSDPSVNIEENLNLFRKKLERKIHSMLNRNQLQNTVMISPFNSHIISDLISQAQRSLQMEAQYIKNPMWLKEILAALDRNVEVEITLPSLCYFNRNSSDMGWLSAKEFAETGYLAKWLLPIINHPSKKGHIRFFTSSIPSHQNSSMGYIHAKAIVIDKKKAWVGSTNGSLTSANHNREFGIVTDDLKQVQYLEKILHEDFKHSYHLEHHLPELDESSYSSGDFRRGTCKILYKAKKRKKNQSDEKRKRVRRSSR